MVGYKCQKGKEKRKKEDSMFELTWNDPKTQNFEKKNFLNSS